MRVLHLGTEKAWRGGENQIRLLCEGLAEKGVHSTVAFPQGAAIFTRLKGSAELLPYPTGVGQLWPMWWGALVNFCRDSKIEILHAHSSGAHSIALRIKRKLPNLKIVVHRRVAFERHLPVFRRRKYTTHLIDRYIAISKAAANTLRAIGVEEARISVVPSAIDLPIGNLDRNDKDTLTVGAASALTKEKGLSTFVTALSLLRDPPKNLRVLIGGHGPLEAKLRQQIRHSRLPFEVNMIGFVDDMSSFLGSLDIFVMPSLAEGLGSTALEAMSAGCCVVASDAGGLKEVVLDGQNGLSFAAGDSRALATQLALSLKDSQLRHRLGESAKSFVRTNFSRQRMVDGCYQVYSEVCST